MLLLFLVHFVYLYLFIYTRNEFYQSSCLLFKLSEFCFIKMPISYTPAVIVHQLNGLQYAPHARHCQHFQILDLFLQEIGFLDHFLLFLERIILPVAAQRHFVVATNLRCG